MLAAVVLAAGASTRMGRPKALLEWGGQSFLRRVVGLAEVSGCSPIVVVEGAIELPLTELGSASRVRNESWSRGQLSSLQVGVLGLPAGLSGVMVLAIDRPRISVATCQALAEAHRRCPERIWQPELGGRRGHPIVYPSGVFAELVGLPSAEGPRAWLRSPEIEGLRSSVAVEDPGIFENLDRPEDLEALRP